MPAQDSNPSTDRVDDLLFKLRLMTCYIIETFDPLAYKGFCLNNFSAKLPMKSLEKLLYWNVETNNGISHLIKIYQTF